MYEIHYKKQAIKALATINNPYYNHIIEAIENLAQNPRPMGYKKLKGRDGYRIRIGIYRIIYNIVDSQLIIAIVAIGSRGSIYEN